MLVGCCSVALVDDCKVVAADGGKVVVVDDCNFCLAAFSAILRFFTVSAAKIGPNFMHLSELFVYLMSDRKLSDRNS